MDEIPNAAGLGHQIRESALRGFARVDGSSRGTPWGAPERFEISRAQCPIPSVMRLACSLAGLEISGPGEKVAWWTTFSFEGARYELAHQKFGLRLRIDTTNIDLAESDSHLNRAATRLVSATRLVEKEIGRSTKDFIDRGDATVANQHRRLADVYTYFRDRATDPVVIEDLNERQDGAWGTSWMFRSGAAQMDLNASHDVSAAVTAYLSLLEHRLVLTLPFAAFDPYVDHLTTFIGQRWGLKWKRVFGDAGAAGSLLARLVEVIEAWRNPYAHGGFEKGHGSTIYVHVPGAGAIPVGLSAARARPSLSLGITNSVPIPDVFELFDAIDEWFDTTWSQAASWIRSGLAVRFDSEFIEQIAHVDGDEARFRTMLDDFEYRQDQIDNMDY